VAGVGTLHKGFSIEYAWAQVGSAAERRQAGAYYIGAAEGGEPPGRWWGPGAQALGFRNGQEIERKPYDLVFGERVHPRDGTRLGRRRIAADKMAEDLYARLLQAEPHATAQRKRELRDEAAREARQSPPYFDLTFSLGKSISLFHASLGENARQAHETGDSEAEAFWAGEIAALDEMIYAANEAALEFFQQQTGYTRLGSHAARANGRETGEWREADLAVASWYQHTSRDGDPQLHMHNQILHAALTRHDGKWRAPDSYRYGEHVGAATQVLLAVLESRMTRRWDLEWVRRPDGYGFEIKGISTELMREFSSRRKTISARVSEAAQRYEQEHGRAPSQTMLNRMAQRANLATRAGKEHGVFDIAQMHAGWAAQLRDATDPALRGAELHEVAPRVSNLGGGAAGARHLGGDPDGAAPLSGAEAARTARKALSGVQSKKSAWTRSDLIQYLGWSLPAKRRAAASRGLLAELADRCLAGEFEPVACLEAPQFPRVPDDLRRADGRSVYQPHGGTMYALAAQLDLEEQLVATAAASGAPRLSAQYSARLLGADAAQLRADLREPAHSGALRATVGCGLTRAQAAAAHHAMTDPCRVSVILAPAGSGKTTTAGVIAAAFRAHGHVVFGTATSQNATTVLRASIGGQAANLAKFLGHSPDGERGKFGLSHDLPAGSVVILDEASLASLPDIKDVADHATARGWKVVLIGDSEQLAAVERGGGLRLLAARLGYAELPHALRFREAWEQEASIRLRAGDVTVLQEYDDHGRVTGAPLEEALEQARRGYVAAVLDGLDPLLMAASRDVCREVGRRIREDLIHYGLVEDGAEVALRDGQVASRGDLIICRENSMELAGEPGRPLTNGDVMEVLDVTPDRVLVRRLVHADPQTGARRYSQPFAYPSDRLDSTDWAYCETAHSSLGRTVAVSTALVTGSETRQWLNTAMTRGTCDNRAIVATEPARVANARPGTRPAPELDRHTRLEREHAGLPPLPPVPAEVKDTPRREAVAVLAGALAHEESDTAATEVLRWNLSGADHMAMLHAQWDGQTRSLTITRYERLVRAALGPQYADTELSHRAIWLWRTLRAAETAGYDAGHLLRQAAAQWPLDDAADVAAVLDHRIRARTAGQVPQPAENWSQRVPETADPAHQQYLRELAAAMDDRTERIGEHLAARPPAWAILAFGLVPADPVDRLEWERLAGRAGAYRELYGYEHPSDPIGPEPSAATPEKRALWHAAFRQLRPPEGVDLRGKNDGSLLHMRDTYATLTGYAPRYIARQLRETRLGVREQSQIASKAKTEAWFAGVRGDTERQARQEAIAREAYVKAAWFRARESEYAVADGVYREYMEKTAPERRLAVAADAEYRNRHPEEKLEPLRSAEPEPVTDEEREAFWPGQDSAEREVVRECPGGEREEAEKPHWAKDLADRLAAARQTQHKAAAAGRDGQVGGQPQGSRRQQATAGSPDAAGQGTAAEADKTPLGREEHKPQHERAEVPGWVKELAERVVRAQEKLAERQAVHVPSEDPDAEGLGMAWPDLLDRERDPLLHPAELNMRPSAGVLAEAARQAGSQAEAGGPEAGG
jgi:conjugative relaxase-like TrwC/TraI family protein